MKFREYYQETSPIRNNYCFDAPNDYLANLMRTKAVDLDSQKPITPWFISARTHFLFYFLHRLKVRPK